MKLVFQVLNSHLKGLTFDTDKKVINIGRSSDNDLVLKQDSISRRHAVITQENNTVTLEDAGSKNATEVDGVSCDGVKELKTGNILMFGDVAVEMRIPELEGAGPENDEDTPGSAIAATFAESGGMAAETPGGMDTGATGGTPDTASSEQDVARTGQPPEIGMSELEGRVWGLLAAVLGIAAAAVAIFFFLNYTGATDRPVAEIGTSLRVGDIKIVEVPSGFVHDPRVSPPDIAEITRSLNLNIAVTVEAISRGMATAELHNRRGDRIVLHINILPRQTGRQIEGRALSREEREQAARERMVIAESLRLDGRSYEAKKLYEEVVNMLHPTGSGLAALQRSAEAKRVELEEKIEQRHDRLRFETSTFVKAGQNRQALGRLEEILELIPDDNDLRRQNAQMLHRMLSSIIERERR